MPVDGQLVPVEVEPLVNKAARCAGQIPSNGGTVVDPHQGLVLAVDGVEMRPLVVADVDLVGLAQPRHERPYARSTSRVLRLGFVPRVPTRLDNGGHERVLAVRQESP